MSEAKELTEEDIERIYKALLVAPRKGLVYPPLHPRDYEAMLNQIPTMERFSMNAKMDEPNPSLPMQQPEKKPYHANQSAEQHERGLRAWLRKKRGKSEPTKPLDAEDAGERED